MKLRKKILFIVLTLTLLITLLFGSFLIVFNTRQALKNYLNSKYILSELTMNNIRVGLEYKDTGSIRSNLNNLFVDRDFAFGIVYDKTKKMVSSVGKEHFPDISAEYEEDLHLKGFHIIELNIYSKMWGNLGWIVLGFRDQAIKKTEMIIFFQMLTLFVLLSVTLIISIEIFMNRLIIAPIDELANTVMKISQGDMEARAKAISSDEIGYLSTNFNTMTEKLKANIRDIHHSRDEIGKLQMITNKIIDSSPNGIITLDKNKEILHINSTAMQILGMEATKSELKRSFTTNEFLLKYFIQVDFVINFNKQVDIFRQKYKINNRNAVLDIHIYPLSLGKDTGAVFMIVDITEKDSLQKQLTQSQKMEAIGTLSGGLAHDFNNILGGIVGSVSLLKYSIEGTLKADNSVLLEYIQTIQESSDRAADMVRQLMTLSRKHEVEFTIFKLEDSIRRIIKICRGSIDKSVEIIASLKHKNINVLGDPVQIEQVVLNICVNAGHAMTIMRKDSEKQGGKLEISLDKMMPDYTFIESHPKSKEIEYWLLSISDTGVGMDQDTLSKIFDPFFTTKDKNVGTGLGLAMAYSIIEKHNGFIDVYSEKHEGTVFKIYLPVNNSELDDTTDKSDKSIPSGKGRILIIDDESVIRQTAEKILNTCGYDVLLANDGIEGLAIYKREMLNIDLVILDMVMPKLTGKETFIELKKINPEIKVILSSGFKRDEKVEDIMLLGIKEFLQKPFNLQKMALIVKNVLLNITDNSNYS